MTRGAAWFLAGFVLVGAARGQTSQPGRTLDETLVAVQQRVVKLYGGALGKQHGYGTGVLVSSDGQIVTTLSAMLETPALRAVLVDGRRFPARVVRRDARRRLALLKIDASDLSAFELVSSEHVRTGDWLIAAANSFKVASGPEPVSISLGVLSGRTTLDAQRHTQRVAYDGPVLLTDIIVSAPGAAGGALVDLDGRLVGVIGEPVVSRRTHTWLNYALPVEQVREMIEQPGGERPVAQRNGNGSDDLAAGRSRLLGLGIRLFDVGGKVRLAYVERVRAGSPARRAGLRAGDLILSVGDAAVETCDDVARRVAALGEGDALRLLVKRGDEVVAIDVNPGGGEQ